MDDSIVEMGLVDDAEIELDRAALALAALDHPGVAVARYQALLDAMLARIAVLAHAAILAADQAAILAQVIAGEQRLIGDAVSYDDPANADLIAVLDRRRGLPVTLAIVYVALARRLGWSADALNTPGHVLVRIGQPPAAVIIDPFAGGGTVARHLVAALLARAGGQRVPIDESPEPLSNRGVLTRLLANQAGRAFNAGDMARALTLYQRMTVFSPLAVELWLERASLEHRLGLAEAARTSLGAVLDTTRDHRIRARALAGIAALGGGR